MKYYKLIKNLIGLAAVILIAAQMFTLVLTANAQSPANNMLWGGYEGNVQNSTGLGNTDPREMAASVVNIILGFLGIVFLLIIIFGVVSGASPDGAEKSKKMITGGVIGLIVVLAAYGIAQFVISALYGATNASG